MGARKATGCQQGIQRERVCNLQASDIDHESKKEHQSDIKIRVSAL